MSKQKLTVALAMAALLTGSVTLAESTDQAARNIENVVQKMKAMRAHSADRPKPVAQPEVGAPSVPNIAPTTNTSATTNNASATSRLTGLAPNGALAPPVTITSTSPETALAIHENGAGIGLLEVTTGTHSPGGEFLMNNAASQQQAVFADSAGTGSAIVGLMTTSADTSSAAIYGQNLKASGSNGLTGIGVEGSGGAAGVYGLSTNGYGVYGQSTEFGVGVYGYASGDNGYGVYAESASGYGVFAELDNGSEELGAAAVVANDHSAAGAGSYGIFATSEYNASAAFFGGSEGDGYCQYMGGAGFECSSDKNLKKDFVPVETATLLDQLAKMPVFEYSMKDEQTSARYVGPTAQDFMTAFHLGTSDKLINTANAQGVALAAAKGLYEKLKQDEVQIAELKRQVAAQTAAMTQQAKMVADAQLVIARFDSRMAGLEAVYGVGAVAATNVQ